MSSSVGSRSVDGRAAVLAGFETLSTAPEHVFANKMMKRVFPQVVDQILVSLHQDGPVGESLAALRDSFLSNDPIPKPSFPDAMVPESAWREASKLIGRSWFELPSYVGESLFYHLLLDAFGYFDYSSHNYERDPFLPGKTRDLLTALHNARIENTHTLSLRDCLLSSLWGNLSDAAHAQFRSDHGYEAASGLLLVDDLDRAGRSLALADTVGIIADNAGSELLADVILAAHLLGSAPHVRVTIYLKQRPFFISDATANDFEMTLSAMISVDPALSVLRDEIRVGRLRVVTHWFFQSPLHYEMIPDDLAADINGQHITVIKGDLNYRRLLADRVTPADHPLEELLPRLGTSLLILRTMKSDICAGLPERVVSELERTTPDWRFSGRYAVAHFIE